MSNRSRAAFFGLFRRTQVTSATASAEEPTTPSSSIGSAQLGQAWPVTVGALTSRHTSRDRRLLDGQPVPQEVGVGAAEALAHGTRMTAMRTARPGSWSPGLMARKINSGSYGTGRHTPETVRAGLSLVERVTGIEPAPSAWESLPSGPVRWPDLRRDVSASDRERPLATGVDGPAIPAAHHRCREGMVRSCVYAVVRPVVSGNGLRADLDEAISQDLRDPYEGTGL
jgi:hypothetical protein